jgi:hypothetical protein
MNILQKNFSALFWGGIFGALVFFLFHSSLSSLFFSANISIPFSNTDSGLEVSIENHSEVTETAPDNGAQGIVMILTYVFYYLKIFLGILVVFWLVFSGFYIVASSTNEESVQKGKKMLIYSVLALLVMLSIEWFVLDVFYGGRGQVSASDTDNGSGINNMKESIFNFNIQMRGVLEFFKTLLIFVAMLYIIKAGVQMVLSWGESERLESAKSMFFPIIWGVLIIMFNEVIVDTVLYNIDADYSNNQVIFSPDEQEANNFVIELVGFLNYIMMFVALILLVFIIYGAFMLIFSLGEEERVGKAKTILLNAFIGVIILLLSYALMLSLVDFDITKIGL